ncbi:hypothetical protein K1719_044956 [Acacia pycnantha]|nr:hypothetical protein K1719_044956 [Acacia pycnantha]
MVEKCGFVKLVPLHVLKSLNNLEELDVNDCDILEIVFDFEDLNDYYKEMDSSSVVVPLKKLKLWSLPKLKNVWSDHYQGNVSFPNLRSEDVYKCVISKVRDIEIILFKRFDSLDMGRPTFMQLFQYLENTDGGKMWLCEIGSLHVLKSLNNLEEVEVISCDMLEIVFDFDVEEMDSSSVVVPLKMLRLRSLPKLKNVWSDHYQGNVSFPSLRSVDVYNCESLTSIFPTLSIAKGMLCDLEELQISKCGVDVIVAKDQVSESVAVTFQFPRLTSLKLHYLPNLRNFYPQKHTLEWPHLQRLSIQCCDELEIFEKEVSVH